MTAEGVPRLISPISAPVRARNHCLFTSDRETMAMGWVHGKELDGAGWDGLVDGWEWWMGWDEWEWAGYPYWEVGMGGMVGM